MTIDDADDSSPSARAERLLQGAYTLQTAEDNVDYYRQFAPIYDQQFATQMAYTYPAVVAGQYVKYCNENDQPVLDVGCGTGLVAASLDGIAAIDGVDISAEMIAVAERKNLYRNFFQQNLEKGCGALPDNYGGVISAGTFTHGHLGPEVIESLLPVGRSGCLFCLGINAAHFKNLGFSALINRMRGAGSVQNYVESYHPIFSGDAGEHTKDRAVVVVFRKA